VLAVSFALMVYVIHEISRAKRQFATRLTTLSINQTQNKLDTFFDQTSQLIHAEEKQYKSGFWTGLNDRRKILHYISLINQYNPISSIGIATGGGYEFDLLPDTVANQWLTRKVFVNQWGKIEKWRRWKMADSLQMISQWQRPLSIEPRKRPWFKGAINNNNEIYWTNPYAYTTEANIGITASLQLPAKESRKPSTIIAFDLTLKDLNRYVSKLNLTHNQNIFILSEDNTKVLALNKYSSDFDLTQLKDSLFIPPEKLNNPALLNVLKTGDNQAPYSFKVDGKKWWGVLKPYHISPSHKINIVTVIPEVDFALEINRTLWIVPIAFLFILILSVLVVWNHNKLHRISNMLAEKNDLISEQKRVLFSEVHHRVKNNLALVSAFLELELLQMNDGQARKSLQQNQQRIKIIAITQEVAYKSKKLGYVPIDVLIPKIVSYLKPGLSEEIDLSFNIKNQTYININQALSYGLLINELIGIIPKRRVGVRKISIKTSWKDRRLYTYLQVEREKSFNNTNINISEKDVLNAFIHQINANFKMHLENDLLFTFDFKPEEKKGIMSNTSY
ncbi:MAG TPA: sensor histidine kinase, partial [Balneolaceae bacterium]|nr:sensor histidine kinase [Balneolaceae bacterium]